MPRKSKSDAEIENEDLSSADQKVIIKSSVTIFVFLLVVWLLASIYLTWTAPKRIFQIERSYNIILSTPYQQIFVKNSAGDNLDFWWIENPKSAEVVLYLHGNSGRLPHFFPFLEKNYSVLAPSYPGFGLSEGMPNTVNVYETAEKAYQWLLDRGYQEDQIIVWSHSLGGSPAIYLASKRPKMKKLVLVNTFSSIQSMCWNEYYIFCTFSGNILNSTKYANLVETDVRYFHYKGDKVIPFSESSKLYQKFTKARTKKFIELGGQTHSYFDVQMTLED